MRCRGEREALLESVVDQEYEREWEDGEWLGVGKMVIVVARWRDWRRW